MAKKAGKSSSVSVNGSLLGGVSATVTPKVQALDDTDWNSGGYGEYLKGVIDCDITVDYLYNVGTAPITLLKLLDQTVDTVPNVVITLATGAAWTFPTFFVETAPTSTQVRDLVKGSFTGRASGTFTPPAG